MNASHASTADCAAPAPSRGESAWRHGGGVWRKPFSTPVVRRGTGALAWLMLAGLIALTPISAVAQSVSREYQVKAVFLWRLAQFVTWPSNAFENAESPLVIGVLGDNPFGEALELAVRGETAHNRRIVVQQFRRVEQVRNCHILFISRSETSRVSAIINSLRGRSVLTVSDMEDFAAVHGGMVRFLSEQNKVRFRINVEAAKQAGLVLDPRLLRMAEIVRPP